MPLPQDSAGKLPPLHVRIRELREERGLSQPELFKRTEGVGIDTIRGVETEPGKARHRYPSARVLEAIADALEIDPFEFPEYRLALARRIFDEREVGLEDALEHLEEFERVLREGALRPLETAIEQAAKAESQKQSGRQRARRPAKQRHLA